ncbi:MAG: phosphoribosylglycinamide formyltransferase [Thiotrichales bacterium TMED285]|jgi:phosphoribosylglycinamide formyltransferase-1|nr:MAG: phosphoribosylglycinamide formyltransferase [Thiotrichales bacterium TMED285]|tara:strand:+ start:3514 stop:4065 length:552 start_codon:yes stop_codon:yes gene_type:complete
MNIIVFFSGSGTNLEAIIKSQDRFKYNVLAAFTNNPGAKGVSICEKYNIQCNILDHNQFSCRKDFDTEIGKFLADFDVDYLILAGYMRILSEDFVADWQGQIINIHPSLLPKYPGLNTHQRVLEAKEEAHGTTIHFVTNELDSGPIIRQESIKIEPTDTQESLMKRIKELENKIYPETISELP